MTLDFTLGRIISLTVNSFKEREPDYWGNCFLLHGGWHNFCDHSNFLAAYQSRVHNYKHVIAKFSLTEPLLRNPFFIRQKRNPYETRGKSVLSTDNPFTKDDWAKVKNSKLRLARQLWVGFLQKCKTYYRLTGRS